MSQLLCAIDSDPAALDLCKRGFRESGFRLPQQCLTETAFQRAAISLWSFPAAPISTADDAQGLSVWLLGYPDEQPRDADKAAPSLLQLMRQGGHAAVASLTGYFAAILQDGETTWFVADLLGLFPLYYATTGQAVVVATAPSLVTLHPEIRPTLDPKGLVGQLLWMHECVGHTVWKGVQRLPAGHVLRVRDNQVNVLPAAAIPVCDEGFGLPYEGQLGQMTDAAREVFSEYHHCNVDVLFSGGLDSRLLAGFLKDARPHQATAYTMGNAGDIEARCAIKAARSLGWPHKLIEVDQSRFSEFASWQLNAEQLANGFNDLSWWQLADRDAWAGNMLLTGFCGDSAMGGSHINWAYLQKDRHFSFAEMFARNNSWGIAPAALRKLLQPQWQYLVDELFEELEASFNALPGKPFQKAWAFDLINRQRYHVAGSAKRISNTIWPAFPLAHRKILKTAGGLPAASLMFRRMQKDLLRLHFADLARIPLDNNSMHPRPLLETPMQKLLDRTWGDLVESWRKRQPTDARYYYRVFDINNAGWRAIRSQVPLELEQFEEMFVPSEAKKLMGSPQHPIQVQHAIRDVSGLKTLMGQLLFLGAHRNGA